MERQLKYAIMQPYFLPYIGYFSLIKETDKWIVFDSTQYKKQSWGNRNRILKHPNGLTWINVPLKKHKRESLYSEIEIQNDIDWKKKMIGQFEYYRQNAPNYKVVVELIEAIFSPKFTFLVDLNIHVMEKICEYLGISFDYIKFSDLDLKIDKVKDSGDWGLQICQKINVKSYINPYMGHFMFHQKDWDDAGIKLQFLMNKNLEYSQKRDVFEEKLSIIDVLMWNSIEEIHRLMESDLYSAKNLAILEV